MRRTIEIEIPEPEAGARLYAEALAMARAGGPDKRPAFDRLTAAREAGSREAAYALGTWYESGILVERDVARAHELFREAAIGGVPEALYNLAVSHEKGLHLDRDPAEAYRCYLRSALLGDLDATYEVFRCLEDAIGTPRDEVAAAAWREAFEARGGDFRTVDGERRAGIPLRSLNDTL